MCECAQSLRPTADAGMPLGCGVRVGGARDAPGMPRVWRRRHGVSARACSRREMPNRSDRRSALWPITCSGRGGVGWGWRPKEKGEGLCRSVETGSRRGGWEAGSERWKCKQAGLASVKLGEGNACLLTPVTPP
jgi:hypothetical protein